MPNTKREIEELLADYAKALRDGCVPLFLKSLTRKEAHHIASSKEFRDAAQMVRVLNAVAFAGKVKRPNVSRFMSHVNAKIASRVRKGTSSPCVRRSSKIRCKSKIEDKFGRPI